MTGDEYLKAVTLAQLRIMIDIGWTVFNSMEDDRFCNIMEDLKEWRDKLSKEIKIDDKGEK